MSAGAIIVSAGSSTRMGGIDKTLVPLGNAPLIFHTLEVFHESPLVGPIILVVAEHNAAPLEQLVKQLRWKGVRVVLGGARRQDSVRCGLAALAPCDWVFVHDGARPLMPPRLLEDGLLAAQATGAAIAAVPAKDTVKLVDADDTVVATPDRATLRVVQTPQVFRRDLLERAHREVVDDVTDDAAMVERLGVPVRVFPGDYANIKVTTPEDLALAEALLQRKDAGHQRKGAGEPQRKDAREDIQRKGAETQRIDLHENAISGHIIDAAIEVHRTLGGPGLLESVYEEALVWELAQRGLRVERQVSLPISYKENTLASPLRIDLIVGGKVIIECKATTDSNKVFESQTLTYLRLTGFKLGLVINFGERVVKNGIHRVVNGL